MEGVGGRVVLKEGPLFAVCGADGEMDPRRGGQEGLYAADTRFLGRWQLRVEGEAPEVLGVHLPRPNEAVWYLTNGTSSTHRQGLKPRSLVIRRHRLVTPGRMLERLTLRNYGDHAAAVTLEIRFGADFAHMFTVRGWPAPPRGEGPFAEQLEAGGALQLRHPGRDGVVRRTLLRFSPPPDQVALGQGEGSAAVPLRLEASQEAVVALGVEWLEGDGDPAGVASPAVGSAHPTDPLLQSFDEELARVEASYGRWEKECTRIETGHPATNALLRQGRQDLRALLTDLGHGPYPVAGLPWFAVPFGRDGLITAFETLVLNPALARAVLNTLAAYQAQSDDPWRDAEPGKILHELREGELAGLGVIPHTPYYGTVDSTPLFVALAARYTLWTGDAETLVGLAPALGRALAWIWRHGDLDGDGYLEYRGRSEMGLRNQGWKDSDGSVVFADGTPAQGLIALVEAQAYAYAAQAWLAEALERLTAHHPASGAEAVRRLSQGAGEVVAASSLYERAAGLAAQLRRDFWLGDRAYLAEALDGSKRPVDSLTSNPGHALWAGMLRPETAEAVGRALVSLPLFSGYGVRTLAENERAYSPVSYHNGSVWPHDNALIAAGLARYGMWERVERVARGLLDLAAPHMEGWRLPELFCGFGVEEGPPVPYPVACSPQAWAAAAPFLLVQALLGLEVDGFGRSLRAPGAASLPGWLGSVRIEGLQVGGERRDLRF